MVIQPMQGTLMVFWHPLLQREWIGRLIVLIFVHTFVENIVSDLWPCKEGKLGIVIDPVINPSAESFKCCGICGPFALATPALTISKDTPASRHSATCCAKSAMSLQSASFPARAGSGRSSIAAIRAKSGLALPRTLIEVESSGIVRSAFGALSSPRSRGPLFNLFLRNLDQRLHHPFETRERQV